MTKNKRFQVTDNRDNPFLCDWSVTDYADGGIVNHPMTSENMANVMCNLLNGLHEENRHFKKIVNEQQVEIDYLAHLNGEFKEENNELKQVIKEVLKLLKEEVDLFSDKAIEHDIQAYIELGELDNKDAYYMAISTKKAIKLLREMIE